MVQITISQTNELIRLCTSQLLWRSINTYSSALHTRRITPNFHISVTVLTKSYCRWPLHKCTCLLHCSRTHSQNVYICHHAIKKSGKVVFTAVMQSVKTTFPDLTVIRDSGQGDFCTAIVHIVRMSNEYFAKWQETQRVESPQGRSDAISHILVHWALLSKRAKL